MAGSLVTDLSGVTAIPFYQGLAPVASALPRVSAGSLQGITFITKSPDDDSKKSGGIWYRIREAMGWAYQKLVLPAAKNVLVQVFSKTLGKGVQFLWNLGTQTSADSYEPKSQFLPFSFADLPDQTRGRILDTMGVTDTQALGEVIVRAIEYTPDSAAARAAGTSDVGI